MKTEKFLKDSCLLCGLEDELLPVKGIDGRSYFFCEKCYLISVAKKHFPDDQSEKARYLTHRNGIQFEGYVSFLRRAVNPALEFIKKGGAGLDYGCGPQPTLSEILKREGYLCEDYDPFFVNHKLDREFDFIFSTEVFEHFFYPGDEIRKIRSLLVYGGILVVMTERWENKEHFSNWYYAGDNSHVCFYHSRTFSYICGEFGFEKIFDDGQRVVILKKTGTHYSLI
ncbi:MAG: class I SAM-dependent methyltransferase [Elusimicrobia bacterium]|nr:class I SAM-dependent methyltransferase [Elusimicrobiota bacterium]